MLFLTITVVLNVLISVLFKFFGRYGINTLQAIVANYFVCVITGSIALGSFPVRAASIQEPWFPFVLFSSLGFITVFNLIGQSTQVNGITSTSIANKLSLIIPVLVAVFLYNEKLGLWHISGLLTAIPAIVLSVHTPSDNRTEHTETRKRNFVLIALLFVLSGFLDSLMKYIEQRFLQTSYLQASFAIHTFFMAGLWGFAVISILIFTGKIKVAYKNIIAGILLGVPNYFSIYYFIKMLNDKSLQSAVSIPLNNIAIVFLSTLAALFFFGEKLHAKRIAGLVLTIAAILLLAL